VVVEFPAGLVDAEEDAAEAAVREMKEETGFEVTKEDIVHIGPMTGADPGRYSSNSYVSPFYTSQNILVRSDSNYYEASYHFHIPSTFP
jgi:8-oxo-dGTP pyrophosphatase MutT (NUDIX family)